MSRRSTAATLLALVALAGCGSDDAGGGDRADPFVKVEQRERERGALARNTVAPRWEDVTTLRGSGDAEREVKIAEDAVQWRARWRCTRGDFELSVTPAPDDGNPLGRGSCPGTGEALGINTGKLELAVGARGSWRATVQQQVTEPISEPPLPAMKADGAEVLASGRFYPVERRGNGKVDLYELANDRLALRLEDFETSANTDLFVWVSEAKRPKTTRQALRSRHDEFALLKSSGGSQNYLLPEGADADSVNSVVIWCEPIRIAYTAAMLR